MAKQKKEEAKKPVFEARLNNIRVSVWLNTGENGDWFNTVISRRYKDGDEWKESNTFNGLADLALVAEANRLARAYIIANDFGVDDSAA